MLRSLHVENLRNIEVADLDFDGSVTAIVGANGAGKTTLLEAGYLLSHGRSFRTSLRERLVRSGASVARSVAVLEGPPERIAGLEFDRKELRIRLGGASASVADIARLLPIQVIDPGVHRLLEEGSARRRRVLDWGVFHVEPSFLDAWRRVQRLLAQRNAGLKLGSAHRHQVWDHELAASADILDGLRSSYAQALRGAFQEISAVLLGEPADLIYQRGWPEGSLVEALAGSRAREERLKTTTVGPHRADLLIRWHGMLARERASRGQQKLIAAALILAQVRLRAAGGRGRTVLLVDDPGAELDVDKLGKLFDVLTGLPVQLVLTALTAETLTPLNPGRVFHVEQGSVERML